jgi:1-deoxyxylulose-5-phosphate synthase
MNKRKLGHTGIQVSELAFGGVEIGMPYGIGVHSKDDMPAENDAISLLHAALNAGINFFDTAREYGQSEAIIGTAFKQKRDEVVIATKCRHLHNPGQPVPANLPGLITGSLTESLAALQTDHADIYMLHDSNPEIIQHPDVVNTFAYLKKTGRIRASGVSTYTPEETGAVIKSGNWDVIQVPFNLLDQRQEALFKAAHQKGVAIVIRSVLMKGLLSNRGRNLHPALAAVEEHIGHLHTFAGEIQTTLPALATRFALSFEEVSTVLVGLDKPEYLEQSIQVANGQFLSTEQLQQVKTLAWPEPAFLNLYDWHVKGWLT